MCGADNPVCRPTTYAMGSSPRVRSRPSLGGQHPVSRGIISACAEQTVAVTYHPAAVGDHLRVCGADPGQRFSPLADTGSSPRVRSRPFAWPYACYQLGIISACAEQTPTVFCLCSARGDHLRVCGADPIHLMAGTAMLGSSPRVRSRPLQVEITVQAGGIISACAEQTSPTLR